MNRALVFTAYNRVSYLQQTLHSWETVRGIRDWDLYIFIEPSPVQEQIKEEFELFVAKLGHQDVHIQINPERYGVLHHPWVVFERLLTSLYYDFAVRAEDDLIVTDDILEYFEWASDFYRQDESVATIHGFSRSSQGDPTQAHKVQRFSPLTWGTWRDRWTDLLSPTWDHDYSTYNGTPGNEAGWDWNITSRLLPQRDLFSVEPEVSRVNNIGVYGTHATPENFFDLEDFSSHQSPRSYRGR